MKSAEEETTRRDPTRRTRGRAILSPWVLAAVFCAATALSPRAAAGTCAADAQTACLIGGRYKVTSHWKNQYAGGQVRTLNTTKRTEATAAFWLTEANTYEFMLRISTATDNGKAWISILTFTDVEFWISVTDTVSGQSFEYHSPAGNRTLIYDPGTFVYP